MNDRAAVEEIRERLSDPRDVARRLELERPRHGGGRYRCPSHGGTSLALFRGRGGALAVRCFGCDLHGDVFKLIAACRGLERFPDVLRAAAELAAIPLPALPHEVEPPVVSGTIFAGIVARLLVLAPLGAAPDAERYLAGRGIVAQAIRDGWAALPRRQAQAPIVQELVRDFGEDALLGSGLFVRDQDTGTLRFSQPGARVCIPWRGVEGELISLQRRRLDAHEPRYLAAKGRPLTQPYGLDRLRSLPTSAPVAFVEGAVDALALRELCRRHRFPCAVLAIPGVETWRAAWAEYARGRRAFVALDGDEAGDRKAPAVTVDLETAGAFPKRWRPRTKDWAEVLKNLGNKHFRSGRAGASVVDSDPQDQRGPAPYSGKRQGQPAPAR
jgi:DNA primase